MGVIARDTHIIEIDGRSLPVAVKVHPRARRMTLRVDRAQGRVSLTLPPGVDMDEGLRFVSRQRRWLRTRLAELPAQIPFADGTVLPILGDPHVIRHWPQGRAGVVRAHGEIRVCGRKEHLARRVTDFLKSESRREIVPRVHAFAERIGRPAGRITLRDTRSRWGSCSSRGDLNFSWRLVLAPEPILDYVVAHEVAHLRHLNHGPRFWALVDELVDDVAGRRRWLRQHGAELLRYGQG